MAVAGAAARWRAMLPAMLLLAISSMLCAGCTMPLPQAGARAAPVTRALSGDTVTPLSRAVQAASLAHGGLDGFRLLADGTDALQMRVALAHAATRTLDLQYYIAEEDNTGKLLLAAALYAADHGVRVRMLVDDLNFKDIDKTMAALNLHPSIEIRVFNPFSCAEVGLLGKITNLLTNLDKLTHRMHNKAMIADNQIAIIGGRNLGDAYFNASTDLDFRDLDVFAAGPIVAGISASFDAYWNSDLAYPLKALNRQRFDPDDIDKVRVALRRHWRQTADALGARPLNATPLAQQIRLGQLGLTWAPAQLAVDSPRKAKLPVGHYESPPIKRLMERVLAARSEVLAISPYFVPRDSVIALTRQLVGRGVRVAVLTNSLAATDAPAVQAGYAPYREPLLRAGAQLYEFKSIARNGNGRTTPGISGSRSRSSLHTKAYVIDRETLVIGSMNLDPRSVHLNTELALFIHSKALAEQQARLFERAIAPEFSYQLRLATPEERAQLRAVGAPASPLVWTDVEDGHVVMYNFDPDAGLARNVLTGLLFFLPLRDQL
ncbi:phospholipase D family protein [Mycetohabitans sp. B5]|uniref:Putative cardiolipin synthase n=1 Tax=Mycetohabitans endofungorum TaxID=417203 RepID=A0A2P5KEH9_9BURK|nr:MULTISPECIES: phospholipase D family protein [Mycetohabitans]MCG1053955.1 phospholipase D family protein [Mycetohabitans sp. B5]PPB85123.1 putative cardiolipin synthase [Mycetohabitans endofungorum]